jgi:acyl carrier protein
MSDTRQLIRQFICDNFIVSEDDFTDDDSMLDKQIIDSTGVLELVAFLEERFELRIADDEMIPENLDTVNRICVFLDRRCLQGAPVVTTADTVPSPV